MNVKSLLHSTTPRFAKHFLVRIGRFYEAAPEYRFPSHEGTLHTLKRLGWEPRNAIDVGAYCGTWTKLFSSVFPKTSILMVEPQESKIELLTDIAIRSEGRVRYETALLGANDGSTVEFFEAEGGSSVYHERSNAFRKTRSKTLVRLDTLLADHPTFQQADIIKLDTQGYELEILQGAEILLSNVDVVFLETSLIPVIENAPLLAEVVRFMEERDFCVFDFCDQIRRKDGTLWQTDLVFINNRCDLYIDPQLTEKTWYGRWP